MRTTKLLNHDFFNNKTVLKYLAKNKKFNKYIECLLFAESNEVLFVRDSILSHQNTNIENYPLLLKDYLKDIKKSVETIIKALVEINNDELLSKLLLDNLYLVGHKISINADIVCSETIKAKYHNYYSILNNKYQTLLNFYIQVQENGIRLDGISPRVISNAISVLQEGISATDGTGHISYVSDKLYQINKIIIENSVLEKLKILFDEDEINKIVDIINFIWKEPNMFYNIYYSVNLQDEKLLDKKDVVFELNIDDINDEFIVKNAGTCQSKKSVISFYEWDVDFSMNYYLIKDMFEFSTQKKFKEGISTIKDYLFRDKYTKMVIKGIDNYVSSHPIIVQSKANMNFTSSMNKLREAYFKAIRIVREQEQDLSYSQWNNLLKETKILHGYKMNFDDSFLDKNEIKEIIRDSTKIIGEKIFDRSTKANDGKEFLKAINESYYIYEMLQNILNYTYSDIELNISEGLKERLNYRDRATFHTELKDSFVIDKRSDVKLNEQTRNLLDIDPRFKEVERLISIHPIHNYIEIDSDALSKNSEIDIEYLIDFLTHTAKLKIPAKYKCNLKFRKLGNYKATGIYFSHTKTIGIDYRYGKSSYIHEQAHHIDLNGYRNGRTKMISLLWNYFNNRIYKRRDYFLKDEELIARAGEIGLLLIISRYTDLIQEKHSSLNSLLEKMKINFENSPYSALMDTWENYFNKDEYIDIKNILETKNYEFLHIIYNYFDGFWHDKENNDTKLIDVQIDYSPNQREYSKSHYSYRFYHCKIYGFTHRQVNKAEYLKHLLNYL